jgi:DNA-binding MarR family transcriptional regulator
MRKKTEQIALSELMQAVGLLIRRMRAASSGHGLSMGESMALARLEREGPATTADLARAEGVKPQSMGATVSALEEMGFVERKPDKSDGRQMIVSITAKGAAVRKSASEAKHAWLSEAVAKLNPEDRATLFAAGKIIRQLAEL